VFRTKTFRSPGPAPTVAEGRRPGALGARLAAMLGEAAMEAPLAGPQGGEEGLRYERKFHPDTVSRRQAELIIEAHPALFRTLYPPRHVNNLYLDTDEDACYRDNIDGVSPRLKFRVRWYGDFHQPAAPARLEVKRKWGLVGDKLRYPLPPLDTASAADADRLAAFLARADLPPGVAARLAGMRGALANRYRRDYYASACARFRATLDDEIEFRPPYWPAAGAAAVVEPGLVIELKYARDAEPEAQKVAARFPFRVARVSKYVLGRRTLLENGLL